MGLSIIGGLGIFILGMRYMSEGMQAVAGDSLRRMISIVTTNRFMAIITGTIVTMLIQSSTVTSVIVVGLVNGGLMQLSQAIGVIVGANIGTTLTGWILVLNIGGAGLPIFGFSALVFLFSRSDRIKFLSKAIMGLGMLFFGLEVLKSGFAPIKDIPQFLEAFAWFEADSYFGMLRAVLMGCIVTILVQSSSATLAITIGLASTGIISFPTAAALIIGENIGTTTTVLLASIGTTTPAKRASWAHVLFNVAGVLWVTSIFFFYIRVIASIVESAHGINPLEASLATTDAAQFSVVMTMGIALTHSLYNIVNTTIFFPFLPAFGRLLERLIPDKEEKEVGRLRIGEVASVPSPVLGVEQSRGEVVRMGVGTRKMMDWIHSIAFAESPDLKLIRKIFHREEVLDNVHTEIITFLTEILDTSVPLTISEEGRQQIRIAHEFESMSDRLTSITKGYLKIRDKKLEFLPEQVEGLNELHNAVSNFLEQVVDAYEHRTMISDELAHDLNNTINSMSRRLMNEHIQRMTEGTVDPNLTIIYTGMLTDYRRVRAHVLNIQEAAAGVDSDVVEV